jgi:hypothetical protein
MFGFNPSHAARLAEQCRLYGRTLTERENRDPSIRPPVLSAATEVDLERASVREAPPTLPKNTHSNGESLPQEGD